MKNLITLSLMIFAFTPNLSHADEGYKLVSYKPELAFTPKEFDTNDNAQVILYGKFVDVCHKVAQPKFTVDLEKHKVYIDNQVYARDLCIEMYVNIPFTVVVNLGTLPEGVYEVFVSNGQNGYTKTDTLPIVAAKSTGGVDNHLYAQVDEVKFTATSDAAAPQLTVKGTLLNTCLSLKEVKVSLSAGNVYDVLPIMEIRQGNCKPSATAFEKTVTLNKFPAQPTLLNVRSSGGQAVEKVIDLRPLF